MSKYIVTYWRAKMCSKCSNFENVIFEIPFEAENDEEALERANKEEKKFNFSFPGIKRNVCRVIKKYC